MLLSACSLILILLAGPTDGGYASPPVGFGYHRATRERHSIQSGGPEEAEEDDDEEEPLPQDLDDIMPNAEQKYDINFYYVYLVLT